ncbi:MAG: hypothetical protein IJ733_06545 [Lachnospiraceae bacterium]|nr:hypothetical protein [Lachnospiraceae bacterium]
MNDKVRISIDLTKEENESLERRYRKEGYKSKNAYCKVLLLSNQTGPTPAEQADVFERLQQIRQIASSQITNGDIKGQLIQLCDATYQV